MIELHHMTASNQYCQLTSVVSHPSFIQIVRDGEILGEVDARFDFTSLPGEYHILALQLLNGHRIVIPTARESNPEPEGDSCRPWWKFW